ncbi:MAG: Hydrolase [Alphaproteobacteria bacterium MarineAlpha11_Bin1]|nr:MAG: Hydrolase [Alphaproteobacteria bacterium MarineAlpha11_Bin1]|tara:strand:+ start:10969 stop:11811 length:843 start_codon:yes stop_codon:yes gene_type:complete
MGEVFRLACVQVNACNDIVSNVEVTSALVREAVSKGAVFVSLPECVALMEPDTIALYEKSYREERHPALLAFSDLASHFKIWLHVGSLAVFSDDNQIVNRTFLIDPFGIVVARYDKIHMFDVDLGDGQEYRESATYKPGGSAVIADLPWGGAGLTICYDVRFPALYTHLANGGADFIGIPSAFTRTTGCAHWHVLMRARAIETGCWVFAAAQCGDHVGGRQTYGHSLVVNPWGEIVSEAGEEPGVIFADIDPTQVMTARKSIPSLANIRRYASPEIVSNG